jgi:transglutaminase-like putative cysteine protease
MSAGMFAQRTFGTDRGRRGGLGRHHLGIVAAAATLLATAPLLSVYDDLTWLVRCAVAVAAIAAAAAGARALRAPAWVQVPAMLGALLLALTWQFPSGDELFLLPTLSTLEHFGSLLAEVPEVVATEAAPVRDHDGLLLLTALGVGLVAITVDLVTVALRRPAVAGLPMLAIYSVPVAVRADSVPALTFVVGAFGYLWLVGADNLDRVRRFGRRFTGDGRDVDLWEPSPLAAVGRRLTVIGALIAVALPLAVPGMTTGLTERFGSGVGGTGSGDGPPTAVNLFAQLDGLLNRDVVEELVRFSTSDPDPFYLRVGVADQITEEGFDHRAPRGASLAEPMPPPALAGRPGIALHRHEARVEILNWNMNRAPTFTELTGVSGLDDEWRYDLEQQVVFSPESGAAGLQYEFAYARPEYDPDALRRSTRLERDHPVQREFTEVIPEPRVSELVDGLVEGIETPYDQVLAIRNYFSRANGFRYSLETGSEVSGSAIVDFLLENKAGYCVQYAVGMAWMVREAGLPSRVAIGFTRGSPRADNTYVLTNHNLHAWTEVYLNGFGWVPFDPTPSSSVAGSTERDWEPDPDAPDTDGPSGPVTGPDNPPSSPGAGAGDNPLEGLAPDPGGGGGGPLGTDRSTWPQWVLGGLAVLLALLILPALRRAQLRRRRMPRRPASAGLAAEAADDPSLPELVVRGDSAAGARHRAHVAWDELLDTLVDFGVPLRPAESPRATARRLVRECRLDTEDRAAAADGVRLLGQAEERARYALAPLDPAGLVPALRAVRRALARQSSRRVRLRAVLMPPSTLLRWRTAVADATGRAAAVTGRLGDALGRLSPRRWLLSR